MTNIKLLLLFIFSFLLPQLVNATTGTMHITTNTTLTEDHFGNIVIDKDRVTLDCDGFSVISETNGITLIQRSGVMIRDCNVNNRNNNVNAFFLVNSNRNTLINNTAIDTGNGFLLINSNKNTLQDNSADDILFPIRGNGFFLNSSNRNTFKNNSADRNSTAFLFISSNENLIEENSLNDNISGFALLDSERNTFKGNSVNDNSTGFFLITTSNQNTFKENSVNNNLTAFFLRGSQNTLEKNIGCGNSVNVVGSEGNKLENNKFISFCQ